MTVQEVGALLFIAWWVYCHIQYRKRRLSTAWYMWLIGIMCGLFGVLVYAMYRRNQKEIMLEEGTVKSKPKKPARPDSWTLP